MNFSGITNFKFSSINVYVPMCTTVNARRKI